MGGARRLLGSLLRLSPVPVLMAVVSFRVDPACLFHNVVAPLADEWARTGETRISGNFDDRLFEEEIVRRAPAGITALLLGSSRSMLVSQASVPGETLLNLSVSGASLQDDLALIEAAWERGLAPRSVLLSLDPWVLNRKNGQDRWRSIEPLYDRCVQKLGLSRPGGNWGGDSRIQKLEQLLSPAYFQQSLKAMWSQRNGLDKETSFIRVIRQDGSVRYPEAYTTRTVEDARAYADQYVARYPVYALEEFTELDPNLTLQLNAFVHHLRRNGMRVSFILPPYHPRVYSVLSSQSRYQQVPAAERWFRTLAEAEGIAVSGSYDPAVCGVTEADFLDGMHLREEALARLIRPSK